MSIWPPVLAIVETKTAITDIIGTSPVRLYPNVLPQGVTSFPAMAYRTVSINGNPSFDGASRLDFNMLEFIAYGTKTQVENLIDVTRTQMEDTRGTFSGTVIKNVRYVDSGGDDWLDTIEKFTKSIEFKVSSLR